MADVGQVLATGATTIVGVTVGAGLTYWLGALNRRHQEAREDTTRWYEARFRAYAELTQAVMNGVLQITRETLSNRDREKILRELGWAVGSIRFVGSKEVVAAAENLLHATTTEMGKAKPDEIDVTGVRVALNQFEAVARKDLGH
jgi:DNA-binding XRE family transcriptional regulator